MENPSVFEELQLRIEADRRHFGGEMPERVALVWHGYLACAIEWGKISPGEHAKLTAILPAIHDNPVVGLLLGKRDG